MENVSAIKGGIVGACLGAASWIATSLVLGGPCSWMAVVVGALTGLAISRMSKAQYRPASFGALALMFSLIAIAGAKFFVVTGELRSAKKEINNFQADEEALIACFAGKLSNEIESQGQSSERLAMDGEFPNKSQFAPPVWQVAKVMWPTLSEEEKAECALESRRQYANIRGLPAGLVDGSANDLAFSGLVKSLRWMDILWIPAGLALAFAFAKYEMKLPVAVQGSGGEVKREILNSAKARSVLSGKSKTTRKQLFQDHDVRVTDDVSDQIAKLRAEAAAAAKAQGNANPVAHS